MTMKSFFRFIGWGVVVLLILSVSASATYYDRNGVKVDKNQYDKILKSRQQTLDQINAKGYRENTAPLGDPILLRKKRVQQWKAMRESGKSGSPRR